jgi:hypothetical protein
VPDELIAPTAAVRFTYETDAGGALVLADVTPVQATALPSDDLDADLAPFAGFWVELRDVDGAVLWRRVTPHPLGGTVEVFADAQPTRLNDDVGAPVVTVIVPALDGADSVALVGSPPAEPDGEVVDLLIHAFEVPVA